MTNSVTEYWEADSESLHTFAHSIETSSEHIRGAPYLRGSDVQVPFRPGEIWIPKVPGPRTITLKMWVRGTDEDGVWSTNPHGRFNENYRNLVRLLWRTDRQIQLTKRWELEDGTIMAATATCEFVAGLDNLQVIDNYRKAQAGKFTVDLRLSDPYFYGSDVTVVPSGADFSLTNPGDDTARRVIVTFSGAGSLTNHETGRVLSVSAGGVVSTWDFSAPGILAGLSTSGQPDEAFWTTLLRDVNSMSHVNVSSIVFTPVYL